MHETCMHVMHAGKCDSLTVHAKYSHSTSSTYTIHACYHAGRLHISSGGVITRMQHFANIVILYTEKFTRTNLLVS